MANTDTSANANGAGDTVVVDPADKGVSDEGKGGNTAVVIDKDNDGGAQETPEAKWARLNRQRDQHLKKHPELAENKGNEPGNDKSTDMDYGQKAFLRAEGIKGADEIALAKQYMESGKTLEEVIENKHFQNDLKDMRDAVKAKEAIPDGKNRSGQTTRDSVDYWLKKGELPPNTPENRELRGQVVNARIKAQTDSNIFSENPVVR